jgi:hypothetical protein
VACHLSTPACMAHVKDLCIIEGFLRLAHPATV